MRRITKETLELYKDIVEVIGIRGLIVLMGVLVVGNWLMNYGFLLLTTR